jgi:bleomycin hydrolase
MNSFFRKSAAFFIPALGFCLLAYTQPDQSREMVSDPDGIQKISGDVFLPLKKHFTTPVKNQAQTGTCWSFSTVSCIESQTHKNKLGAYDISEMFVARNIYLEKARNYILRQGKAQFSQGALAHDAIRAIETYGAMPETVYSGLLPGQKKFNHDPLFSELKTYVDSIVFKNNGPLTAPWQTGFIAILDKHMGKAPTNFVYNQKKYTPKTFATEVLKFNSADFVNLTSFTHHPYYKTMMPEVPDNFSNGSYFNLPIEEMIKAIKDALEKGYTVVWDTDVSNDGFQSKQGLALFRKSTATGEVSTTEEEEKWSASIRQERFENLITQDDHLMHIVGIEKTKEGKTFFIVKNSWGDAGPFGGFIHVSEAYIAINTITIVLPKAALDPALMDKLK